MTHTKESPEYPGRFIMRYGASNVTVGGHSLGGAIATAISARTGARAVAFNTLGVTGGMIERIGGSTSRVDVTSYYTNGDPLRLLNFITPARAFGDRISVGGGGHSMGTVCAAMGCW